MNIKLNAALLTLKSIARGAVIYSVVIAISLALAWIINVLFAIPIQAAFLFGILGVFVGFMIYNSYDDHLRDLRYEQAENLRKEKYSVK